MRVQSREKITLPGGRAKEFRENDLWVILWSKESFFIPQAHSEHPLNIPATRATKMNKKQRHIFQEVTTASVEHWLQQERRWEVVFYLGKQTMIYKGNDSKIVLRHKANKRGLKGITDQMMSICESKTTEKFLTYGIRNS